MTDVIYFVLIAALAAYWICYWIYYIIRLIKVIKKSKKKKEKEMKFTYEGIEYEVNELVCPISKMSTGIVVVMAKKFYEISNINGSVREVSKDIYESSSDNQYRWFSSKYEYVGYFYGATNNVDDLKKMSIRIIETEK